MCLSFSHFCMILKAAVFRVLLYMPTLPFLRQSDNLKIVSENFRCLLTILTVVTVLPLKKESAKTAAPHQTMCWRKPQTWVSWNLVYDHSAFPVLALSGPLLSYPSGKHAWERHHSTAWCTSGIIITRQLGCFVSSKGECYSAVETYLSINSEETSVTIERYQNVKATLTFKTQRDVEISSRGRSKMEEQATFAHS